MEDEVFLAKRFSPIPMVLTMVLTFYDYVVSSKLKSQIICKLCYQRYTRIKKTKKNLIILII